MDQVPLKANREKYVISARCRQTVCYDLFLCSYFHSDISNILCAFPDGAITEIYSPFCIKLIINKHFNIKHINIKHIKTQSHDLGVGKAFSNMTYKKITNHKGKHL